MRRGLWQRKRNDPLDVLKRVGHFVFLDALNAAIKVECAWPNIIIKRLKREVAIFWHNLNIKILDNCDQYSEGSRSTHHTYYCRAYWGPLARKARHRAVFALAQIGAGTKNTRANSYIYKWINLQKRRRLCRVWVLNHRRLWVRVWRWRRLERHDFWLRCVHYIVCRSLWRWRGPSRSLGCQN